MIAITLRKAPFPSIANLHVLLSGVQGERLHWETKLYGSPVCFRLIVVGSDLFDWLQVFF
jgi:hypothetical protein